MEKLVRILKIILVVVFVCSILVFILLETAIAQGIRGDELRMLFIINNTLMPITMLLALANVLVGFIGMGINWRDLGKRRMFKWFAFVYGIAVLLLFLVLFAIANTHLG